MPRTKGSVNKKRPEGVRSMKALARVQGVKLKNNASYAEMRERLGLEAKSYSVHYCGERKPAQIVVKVIVNTGEREEFKSIYKASKALGLASSSIISRFNTGKLITLDGCTFSLSKV